MNSTEEDTYKKLKSLTLKEIEALVAQSFVELNPNGVNQGLPVAILREKLDPVLKPYGWTLDRYLYETFNQTDIS